MSKLDEEVAFLKRFRRRFKTGQGYEAAVKDLYVEGLITRKAYEAVIIKNTEPASPRVKPQTRSNVQDDDPCGNRGYFRSGC